MMKYEFTIVLSGEPELDEGLADRLFAAGCEDGSPGSCNRVVSVDFHREANSLEEAIRSAIANVQAAGCTVAKVEIAPDAEVLQV
jgi:hypothetical protein